MSEQPRVWVKRTEFLTLRLGRRTIRKIAVRSLSLANPCTTLDTDIGATLSELPPIPADCEAVVLPAHPVCAPVPRLTGVFGPVIRYRSNSGPRHLVDLRGSFEEYASKFNHKRRHGLTREARKFAELSGGTLQLRAFRTPIEMRDFQRIAAAITAKTYKVRLGAAFDESADQLADAAARGTVRGYVLFFAGEPVAYELMRIQERNLLLASTSYDPAYAKSSPGTVLLWLVLQSLFDEQGFDYLDFLWGQYPYKKLFATTTVNVAAVFCFRNTLRNRMLVVGHFALILASRLLAMVKRAFARNPPG
jgi:CelD/BcsL family acetyltransferase involved in cellulose biosynthesis